MSKTALRKELAHLDAQQLRELVIELYEARKEAKEYLEFYVNPDVDTLLARFKAVIEKETSHAMRRRTKPRMSRLRKTVKDFSSFNPGPDYVSDLMCHTLEQLCAVGHMPSVKEPVQLSIARFLGETLTYIDRNGLFGRYIGRLTSAIDSTGNLFAGRSFRRMLREQIDGFTPVSPLS